MLSKRFSFPSLLSAVSLSVVALWPLQAHALFEDDDARKAIIDLRNKFEAHRQTTDATLSRLVRQAEEGNASGQRGVLELANQNEQLRGEITRLQGQIEQLQRDVAQTQQAQKAIEAGAAEQARKTAPQRVEIDGLAFSATPDEIRDFDGAMALLRKADFGPAETAFGGFLKRYSSSGYTPSALYWLGNAQYANRAYAQSIVSHQRLVGSFPDHMRSPEALLAVANSQVELKDGKAARQTLSRVVKEYGNSEAAAAARERLSRLK